jgi:hypothetical protein
MVVDEFGCKVRAEKDLRTINGLDVVVEAIVAFDEALKIADFMEQGSQQVVVSVGRRF